jgi:putative transposase
MARKDAAAIERMRELSAQYPRYGYRRIRIFLGRDGHRMSVGRAYRLWRAARLQVPRKRPRKRVAAARSPPLSLRTRRTYGLKSETARDPWSAFGLLARKVRSE